MNELNIVAEIEAFEKVSAMLEEFLEESGAKMAFTTKVLVAFEEMFVNVAHYAYPDENSDKNGMVKIIYGKPEDKNGIVITIIDSGVPFNPLEKKDPDVTLSAEERAIGGLGIFMVKKTMDKVSYEYKDGQNIFSMEAYF